MGCRDRLFRGSSEHLVTGGRVRVGLLVLEALALAAVVFGVFLWSLPAACIVGGAAVILAVEVRT